jgi:hypothetical protein
MSISNVSSGTPVYQASQPDSLRQNFQQLSQSLQTGNLANAQQAYAALMQNLPSPNTSSPSGASNNPFQQGLAAVGTALQSGDLAGAQQALQTIAQKGGHHGHHHRHVESEQGPSSTTSKTSTNIGTISGTSGSISIIA